MWRLIMMHSTSPHRDPAPGHGTSLYRPPPDIGFHCTGPPWPTPSPDSGIWRPTMVACSNLFTWVSPWYWHLMATETHTVGKLAVCILLECFLVESLIWIQMGYSIRKWLVSWIVFVELKVHIHWLSHVAKTIHKLCYWNVPYTLLRQMEIIKNYPIDFARSYHSRLNETNICDCFEKTTFTLVWEVCM